MEFALHFYFAMSSDLANIPVYVYISTNVHTLLAGVQDFQLCVFKHTVPDARAALFFIFCDIYTRKKWKFFLLFHFIQSSEKEEIKE